MGETEKFNVAGGSEEANYQENRRVQFIDLTVP
jgi:hypothetical protein